MRGITEAKEAEVVGRGRGRPARVTQATILDAALQLFLDKGFQGTSLRDLANQLDVTTAALYYHFPSKMELLDSLIGPYLDALEEITTSGRDDPPRERRMALVRAYMEILTSNLAVARLVDRDITALTDPRHGARLATVQNRLRRAIAEPERGREALLVAASAIGLIRRPVLELGLRNQREIAVVQDLAGRVLDTLP